MSRKSKAAAFLEDIWDISVTGRHVLVTDAMKNYAIDKISKIERFSSRVIDANVIMDIQKLVHRVDIIIKVDNTKIKVTASSDNMYASIDKVVDRLKEKIRRYKEKLHEHHSPSHEEIAMNVNIYSPADDLKEFNEEIEAESNRRLLDRYRPGKVVKKETRNLKTLNLKEACREVDLSEDNFLIFVGEEDKEIKVIYKRKDGNLGIIQPKK
jgi:putative sigma-54 modulation protein